MSILGRLFGNQDRLEMERRFEQVKAETWETYEPLGNFGLAIVTATWNSYKELSGVLQLPLEGRPSEQQILTFYELLYFFIHISIRRAAHELAEAQMTKLQAYIGPQLSRTAVDTFCKHWPTEMKMQMAEEFFETLNNSEAEYSECRTLIVKDEPFESASLLGKLSHNIAKILAKSSNPVTIMAAKTSAFNAFASMPLDKIVQDVALVIDRVSLDEVAALRDRAWT